jgi:hypothetical protein
MATVSGAVRSFVSATLLLTAVAVDAYAADAGRKALLEALPAAKVALADGIRQLEQAGETVISAKFELDDNGKLSLSVYTAEKGLTTDAEHNVLKEYAASPESKPWNPEVETFKDFEHVARASQQLTLMALSRHSLAQIVKLAQKDHRGTVFSVTPAVANGRAVAVVLIADHGETVQLDYELISGRRLDAAR